MRLGIPLALTGILFVLIPITLVNLWPYAASQQMPADISKYPNSYYAPKNERLISWNDSRLDRTDANSDYEYAIQMLETVHNATYHCEAHNYQQSWFTWLTWRTGIYSLLPRNNQGILDLKTFRCGFCHQRAFILARVLRRGGIDSAEVLGLSGHVVTVFTDNGELFALDPDLGVGPVKISGLDSAQGMPDKGISDALYQVYQPITNAWGEAFTNKLVDIYISNENNRYYVYNSLEARRTFQSVLFSLEKYIELCFIVLGIALSGTGLLMMYLNISDLKHLIRKINKPGIKTTI